MSQVEQRVFRTVEEEAGLSRDHFKREARIFEDLGMDSFDRVEMLMSLEEEFGIEITDEVAVRWNTLGDVISSIEEMVDG